MIVCLTFNYLILNSQSLSNENIILESLVALDFKKADSLINNSKSDSKYLLKLLYQQLYQSGNNQSFKLPKESELFEKIPVKDNFQVGLKELLYAYNALFYNKRDGELTSFIDKSYQSALSCNNANSQKLSLLAALRFYTSENIQAKANPEIYIKRYEKLATNLIDTTWIRIHKYLQEGRIPSGNRNNLQILGELIVMTSSHHNEKYSEGIRGQLHSILGIHYWTKNDLNKAEYHLNKVIQLPNYPYLKESKFNAYLDYSRVMIENHRDIEAENALSLAYENINESDSTKNLITFYKFKAHYFYRPQNKYDSAYTLLNKAFNLDRKISYGEINAQIANLDKKLNVAAKDKTLILQRNDLLQEQSQKRQAIIGLGSTILLGSIIAFLVYRNTKRKQRIAEQERELEIQKTTQILKEQEVTTINAMVAGQEKERQRLAGDLHDGIGSTLAAIKMHLGTMQKNASKTELKEELLDKAHILIGDAYSRVRSIAHERNSGVMAKDGLLPAIERLAKNVSGTNLAVSVQDFGLDKRLSNDLEITIFRIVQELVTNIIKHAQASEASISLTQHEDTLSIIVEDNGRGFKVGKLEDKDGIGLGSIERRVEHLEGAMEVDSALNKGTTVLIDVPV